MVSSGELKSRKINIVPFKEAVWPSDYFVKSNRSWLYSYGALILFYLTSVFLILFVYFLAYGIYNSFHNDISLIKSPYLILADVMSQLAIVFFSLDFVLATRLRLIEYLFGGLDRVYKAHNIAGRLGMMLLCLHFAFVLFDAGRTWDVLSVYIVPGLYLPYTLGIIAFWSFIILIVLTVWIKIPYNLWLLTHKLMGIPFILGGIHAWLSAPEYSEFHQYRTLLIFIWSIGVLSYIYKTLLYKYIGPKYEGIVTNIYKHDKVYDVFIKVLNKRFRPLPGQFVSLSINRSSNKIEKEFHPFSISGIYKDNVFRLSIKSSGDYTASLDSLANGDEVVIQGPYGLFGDKFLTTKKDMVWIAGGIGIAPFLFMAEYQSLIAKLKPEKSNREISFFWSLKSPEENYYDGECRNYTNMLSNFKYTPHYTGQHGRISAQTVITAQKGIGLLKDKVIFICGPVPMMRSLADQFIKLGVHPKDIVYEEFEFN